MDDEGFRTLINMIDSENRDDVQMACYYILNNTMGREDIEQLENLFWTISFRILGSGDEELGDVLLKAKYKIGRHEQGRGFVSRIDVE